MIAGRPRRVLFVNHTALMAGAEHSLVDLVTSFDREEVEAVVACPRGELSAALADRGVRVRAIPGTELSFRVHPLHTPVGIGRLGLMAGAISRVARDERADLVHANTTRAGLAAIAARGLGGPPALVHLRDPVSQGRAGAATARSLARGASALVANSAFVASGFERRSGAAVRVVHNPVDAARFDPHAIDRAEARRAVGLSADEIVATVVGQLTPIKGQDTAVRAVAELRDAVPELRLLIVGAAKFQARSARRDSVGYESELRALVERLGVGDRVRFTGERSDVPLVLRASDMLLVPSWEEPFGRVVVEGMAMQLPVLAGDAGGPREIIRDGRDGLLIAPRDPKAWAREITSLTREPERRSAIGREGRARCLSAFTRDAALQSLLDAYDTVLGAGSPNA